MSTEPFSIPLFDPEANDLPDRLGDAGTNSLGETRRRDVHDEIEVEVRIAADNLRSAQQQLTAANETLRLAEEE